MEQTTISHLWCSEAHVGIAVCILSPVRLMVVISVSQTGDASSTLARVTSGATASSEKGAERIELSFLRRRAGRIKLKSFPLKKLGYEDTE